MKTADNARGSGTPQERAGLFSSLVTAVFAGTLTVVLSASFAALIFPGDMARFIPQGIALAITASVIVGFSVALFSHCQPTISMADEDTAPVFALLAALVVSSLPASATADEMFASALAAILISTIVAGLGLALLGYFKFGRLVQYLPYSVMGGYFAAVGWLLLVGGLQVATGIDAAELQPKLIVESETLAGLLPAAIVALWLMAMGRRIPRGRLLPLTILVAIPLWYAIALGLGYSPAKLMAEGHLIGPFVSRPVWLLHPFGNLEFQMIHWQAVFSNVGLIGAIFLMTVLSMILSISGLALLTRDELDMDRELKIAGLSNMASGLGGGMTGLPSYSLSRLALDMGAPRNSRVGLLTIVICVLVFLFGLELIAYTPRFLLGAILIYLGISFLYQWLVEAWRSFSKLEYLVIPIILTTSATLGFLMGLLVGLIAAVILFVVKYSQTDVIRFAATGADIHSNVDRNASSQAYIKEHGERIFIIGLQGYLFFGTAGHVYDRLLERAKRIDSETLSYAVIDFSGVTGLDASASLNFQRMALLASKAEFRLLIAGLDADLMARLMGADTSREYRDVVAVYPDLDRAIEWCEEDLLSQQELGSDFESCFKRLRPFLSSDNDLATLKQHLEQRLVEANTTLTTQGDDSRELFFIETSAASAYITDSKGETHRVRRTRQGTVYGEMGFYLGNPRTATVVIDDPGVVYVLSTQSLAALEDQHPEIASALHRYMAMLICERLRFTTDTLAAVLI